MRQHAIVVAREQRQELEFLRRQPDLGLVPEDAPAVVVDRQIAGAEDAGLGVVLRRSRGAARREFAPAAPPGQTAW